MRWKYDLSGNRTPASRMAGADPLHYTTGNYQLSKKYRYIYYFTTIKNTATDIKVWPFWAGSISHVYRVLNTKFINRHSAIYLVNNPHYIVFGFDFYRFSNQIQSWPLWAMIYFWIWFDFSNQIQIWPLWAMIYFWIWFDLSNQIQIWSFWASNFRFGPSGPCFFGFDSIFQIKSKFGPSGPP